MVELEIEAQTEPRVIAMRNEPAKLPCRVQLQHNLLYTNSMIGFTITWLVESISLVIGEVRCEMKPDISFSCDLSPASISMVSQTGNIPGNFNLLLTSEQADLYANETFICQVISLTSVSVHVLSESSVHLVVVGKCLT